MKKEPVKKLNERFITQRRKHNLTQKQLAEAFGLSQSMIARIESGGRDPNPTIKVSLARFFGVTVEWLFYEQINDLESLRILSTGTDL